MEEWQSNFTHNDVEIIERRTAYQGYFHIDCITLRHKRFDGQWSQPIRRELFERGNAAAVLLYDIECQKLVLIEQFRIGAVYSQKNPWVIEIVAGIVGKNELEQEVVIRETKEETGLIIREPTYIQTFWSSPGGSTEKIDLFWAKVDSSQAHGIHGLMEEGEDIRIIVADRDAVFQALNIGKFQNAITIIALQWLQLNYQQLEN